jgi:tetratricopeptide (TPR) repeat protein
VSVINKMLQDLDRRSAIGTDGPQVAAQPVKAVAAARQGHEWFWRVLAVLVMISLGWVGWVAYQIQPRPLVTPLALMVAQKSTPVIPEKPATAPVAVPVPVALAQASNPEPVRPAETFRLARSIETPIAEPRARPAEPRARPAAAEAKKPEMQPVAAAEPAAPATKALVDKRDRSKGKNEAAEAHFRSAAALLNQARVSEAEEQLAAALQADPSHVPARQAYVALLLEQHRVSNALRLLQEAVDANPAQPTFSLGLARIYAEQREYAAALAVLDKSGPAARGAEFQVLRAAVLQRLGRHAEAVSTYQEVLQKSAQPGGTWTGLGISLEAVGRRSEAAQAYHHALAAGLLPAELRDYAEARIKALQ